jgi:hypothetical protein
MSHVRGRHKLKLFRNNTLRRIFGPKTEVEIRWKMHNDELHNMLKMTVF